MAFCLGVEQDYLEQVLEPTAEVLHHLLLQLRPCLAAVRLEGWKIVLADAEIVGELPLGQPAHLTPRLEASGSDLDPHAAIVRRPDRGGIIGQVRIVARTQPILSRGGGAAVARRRSLASWLYRLAGTTNDVETLASGDPNRIARRAKNNLEGLMLRRGSGAGLWR